MVFSQPMCSVPCCLPIQKLHEAVNGHIRQGWPNNECLPVWYDNKLVRLFRNLSQDCGETTGESQGDCPNFFGKKCETMQWLLWPNTSVMSEVRDRIRADGRAKIPAGLGPAWQRGIWAATHRASTSSMSLRQAESVVVL